MAKAQPRRTAGSEILDQLPPQDLAAEKAVLGSLLLDPSLMPQARLLIEPKHFYADAHQKLYACLLEMGEAGSPIDTVTLKDQLRRNNHFETVGGAAYLAEVAQSVPYAANWKYYTKIVLQQYARRSLVHASTGTLRDCYDPRCSLGALCKRGQRLFQKMAEWLKARGLSD